MAVSVLLIVALALAPRFVGSDDEQPWQVDVVAGDVTVDQLAVEGLSAEGREIAFRPAGSRAQAEQDLGDDGADALVDLSVVPPQVVVAQASDAGVASAVAARVDAVTLLTLVDDLGGPAPQPAAVSAVEDDADRTSRTVLAYVVSLVLFTQVVGLGSAVAQGTMEEKTTRVVDVVLTRVAPRVLLMGKVLGIGVFGVLQMALLGAVAVTAVQLSGSTTLSDVVLSVALVSTGWFLLGFLFYGFVYGALAALAPRPESLATLLLPLQLLNAGVFVTAVLALQALQASWVQALSWVPPFSAILMPMRLAAGETSGAAAVGPALVLVLSAAVAAVVGGRVYSRSIRNVGQPLLSRRGDRRPEPAPSR